MRGGVANSPPLNVLTACRNLSSVLWKKALLNREASFLFFPAKARIECVCMRIYIFQCSMQRLALPAHRPKMASHDGALQKEKITSRSKAIYSSISSLFPAFLRKQKNKSNGRKYYSIFFQVMCGCCSTRCFNKRVIIIFPGHHIS